MAAHPTAPGDGDHPAPYPVHWEADVVLRDGATAHIRPIRPDDADRLVAFYAEVSDESKYYRFFAPYPRLSDRDVRRFTHHDYVDRVGLAATVGGEFIATVRYDRIDAGGGPGTGEDAQAEVAFLVQDAHQGRGVASALLEHIAAVARERGIRRFVAEVLPANRRMVKVFTDAGYTQRRTFEEGVVRLEFDIEPTDASVEVMRARELRAEARSVRRLLGPGSVAVVGVGRRPGGAGRTILGNLLRAGFTGRVHAVNRAFGAGHGTLEPEGVPAYRSVADIPEPVDLAVIAVPAGRALEAVAECGAHGVQGVVVVAAGYAETGQEGRDRQRELVRRVRTAGMRLIGPNAFGIANAAPGTALNATLAPRIPRPGSVGLFTQSGAIGIALLAGLDRRGIGLSSFVSVGNRADVSGNDLLQYWHEDPATGVVLMYLESFGNPRKFTRLARRTARAKPVVVVKGGRHTGGVPPGHHVPGLHPHIPDATVDALFRQAGVIRVDNVTELLDVGLLLDTQPLPTGDRVAITGNSESLGVLAHDACLASGLRPGPPDDLTTAAGPADFRAAVAAALADEGTDAVLVTVIPPVGADGAREPWDTAALARALHEAAEGAAKPVLVTHLALDDLPGALLDAPVRVPAFPAAERAVRALSQAARHARWLRDEAEPGRVPQFDDVDEATARAQVASLLADHGTPDGAAVPLGDSDTSRLLARYGIHVRIALPAPTADCAAQAARLVGYPVALKTTAERLRHRPDLGGVRLDLADEDDLRRAFRELAATLGDPGELRLVVQPMARRGVDTVVRAAVDPAVGAVLSFGLAGPASDLLGDLGHRLVPATDRDAAELVRSIRAAPLLFGYRGSEPVDTAALENLLLRVSQLVHDLPEVVALDLEPVVVAPQGLTVLSATVSLAHPPPRDDLSPRRLSSY
jgi:acyl-CoA synthetase (NDP forming)/RimJ/RimL family protein N-acetyltransferase